MNLSYGRFGPLIGTIYIGNRYCKFLVYAARNAEELTCHEEELNEIVQKPGWKEFDPQNIWYSVKECINEATNNLIRLDINPADIVAIAVTNQRETTILWNKTTGAPLCNAIAWDDSRTCSTVNTILSRLRKKRHYLQEVCGLPINPCFSALKIKWLIENVADVGPCIAESNCRFGTLDSWIIWNLTGGLDGGIHMTDVTNASRTLLMNLKTLQWDRKLCTFFKIPIEILPKITSCSEVFGFIHSGVLQGIPIAGCISEQPASLLGQMCIRTSQTTCTINDSCHLLVNTGQEIIHSDNGLLSTVAFKLGPRDKPYYALEGAIANSGSALRWINENLAIQTDVNPNPSPNTMVQSFYGDSAVISTYSSGSTLFEPVTASTTKTDVLFVPAFCGLFTPYWEHNAKASIHGINPSTTAHQITLSAYEAICYQVREVLEAFTKDLKSWPIINRLTVGGELSENRFLMQLLADLCGVTIERPQTSMPSCMGAMLAAGLTMKILKFNNLSKIGCPPSDLYQPIMCSNQRDVQFRRWKYAVQKCLCWKPGDEDESGEHLPTFSYSDRDPDLTLRHSIPGGFFLFTSFTLVLVTRYMMHRGLLWFSRS